tara:strand:+ start:404 stop:1885 length:1482 start_codon:yes stop_codon:yes gene_type:complete
MMEVRSLRATGPLELLTGGGMKLNTLHLRSGRLMRIDGRITDFEAEDLGVVLTTRFDVSPSLIDQARARIQGVEGFTLSSALIEMGGVKRGIIHRALDESLRQQVEALLLDKGDAMRYAFSALTEGPPTAYQGLDLALPVAAHVLLRGDLDECRYQLRQVAALQRHPKLVVESLADRFQLGIQDRVLLELLTVPRRPSDLMDADLEDQDRTARLLRALKLIGMLRSAPEDRVRAVVPLEIRRIYKALPQWVKSGPTATEVEEILTEEQAAFLEEVEGKQALDLFTLFDVPQDCTERQVSEAFVELAQKWHPDRGVDLPYVIKDALTKLFAKINDGRDMLLDETTRNNYIGTLENRAGAAEAMHVEQSPEVSALETAKAKVFIRKKDFRSARAHLRRARQLDTSNREAQRLLAVVVLTDDSSRPKAREDALAFLTEHFPSHHDTSYYAGLDAMKKGLQKKAERLFKDTLETYPGHREAARYLRLFKMRDAQGPG